MEELTVKNVVDVLCKSGFVDVHIWCTTVHHDTVRHDMATFWVTSLISLMLEARDIIETASLGARPSSHARVWFQDCETACYNSNTPSLV